MINEIKRRGDAMKGEKVSKAIIRIAERVVKDNINTACFWVLYQPKIPQSALKKFNIK